MCYLRRQSDGQSTAGVARGDDLVAGPPGQTRRPAARQGLDLATTRRRARYKALGPDVPLVECCPVG